MGRKKIEIKPLTDERNRNVTFLKRKAGLMKKAYELSVLCGVSVSILIFASNGKPYEFSSADFDTEVDRYNDYEGAIERRRAAEFEAMALAGEEDDDEEDEKPGAAKKPVVSKSLKGKESFKSRRVPRGAAGDRGGPSGSSDRRRRHDRDRDHKPDESFIGALLDDAHPSSQHHQPPPQHPHNQYHDMPQHSHHSERSPIPPDSPTTASLSYAMGLHQTPPAPSPQQQGAAWNSAAAAMRQGGGPYLPFPNAGFMGPAGVAGPGSAGGGGGWDSGMFTTYAWLQIQQAHQEQKRQLLEKQQHQLLELTPRSGGHAFIRDMLGAGLGGSSGGAQSTASGDGGSGGGQYSHQQEFVWPTAPMDDGSNAPTGVSTPPDEDLIWALSGAGSGGGGGGGGVPVPMQQGHAPPPPMPQGNMPSWRVDGRDDRAKRMRM